MKKLLALLLAFVMVFSLAACESEKDNDRDDRDDDDDRGSIFGNHDSDESDKDDKSDKGDKSDSEDKPGRNQITFTEMVAVDNEECLIKITDIDPDGSWGFTLKAYVENKSTEKTYMYSVYSASVNGVQCDPLFAAEVAPGKKANEEISFSTEEFEMHDVGDFTDIALTFRVSDYDDWSADPVAFETVHIYPYGEDKAVQFVREPQATDNVIIDNEYVTVIVTDYDPDSFWGYSVNMFLINKTDKNVMFSANDVSVNGFMVDPFYGEVVFAGNCAFTSMSWFEENLEENNITDIEEIEFTFRAFDYDDWNSDDFANESVTLNP